MNVDRGLIIIRKVDYKERKTKARAREREREREIAREKIQSKTKKRGIITCHDRNDVTLRSTTGVNFMTRDLICSRQFTTLEYFSVFTLILVKWHPAALPAVRHTIASRFFPCSCCEPSTYTLTRGHICTLTRYGNERKEESAWRTRLFHAYFISHGIASGSVLRHAQQPVLPFSKTRTEGTRVSTASS